MYNEAHPLFYILLFVGSACFLSTLMIQMRESRHMLTLFAGTICNLAAILVYLLTQ